MAKKRSTAPQNLPEEVVDAAFRFGRAVFRRALKDKSHRNPKDSDVDEAFQAFLKDGRIIDDVRRHVAKCEILVKTSGIKLDKTGRAIARQLVIDRFDTYCRLLDRPKGRPKKLRISLINGFYYRPAPTPDAKRKKAHIGTLKQALVPRAAGAKLRMFIRSEGMDHLNVERALQYIRERNLFQDLCEVRAHSKAVKDFLTANNLDLSLAPRFEKELSRKGKAVDNFLAKKLRKQ